MLVQLTEWLQANCHAAYLPEPNPRFDPAGPLPYGPYVPLDKLKASLGAAVRLKTTQRIEAGATNQRLPTR